MLFLRHLHLTRQDRTHCVTPIRSTDTLRGLKLFGMAQCNTWSNALRTSTFMITKFPICCFYCFVIQIRIRPRYKAVACCHVSFLFNHHDTSQLSDSGLDVQSAQMVCFLRCCGLLLTPSHTPPGILLWTKSANCWSLPAAPMLALCTARASIIPVTYVSFQLWLQCWRMRWMSGHCHHLWAIIPHASPDF